MKLIKRALGIYVQSKSRIDKARRHQFALVLMKDTALWVSKERLRSTGELGYDRLNGTRKIGPSYAKSIVYIL